MADPRHLSALDVYKKLTATAHELDAMADQCWGVAGATALRATARLVRACASGFFMSIKPEDEPTPQAAPARKP
jgi:hypothetical protein